MRRLLFLLCACALSAFAQVVLLPLDSRPATSELPARIAALSGETVSVPPPGLLGDATRGADPEQLTSWLNRQPPGPLIVALDALAYGGLVQSRKSDLTTEQVLARLVPVREWTATTGQPVYAFITLPREPDATNRARNLAVAQKMVEWARDGVFAELHVTWDDAGKGSPAPQEGEKLRAGAPANVMVYPGVDEVLSSLVALALAPAPRVLAVEFSDPVAARKVANYEGVPLTDSVRLHAEAAGWTVVPVAPAPILTPFGGTGTRPLGLVELYLYVYNGGDSRAAALRVSQLLRAGRVALADVRSVNQGNYPMWSDLHILDRPQDLSSLAAWGTPGNNIGTALAHAAVALHAESAASQDALLAHEYVNDVIFSAKVRPELRGALPEKQLDTPQADQTLTELAQRYFPLKLGNVYLLEGASLPWNRSFEWRFDLKPVGP